MHRYVVDGRMMFEPTSTGLDHALVVCDLTQILVVDGMNDV